MLFKNVIGQDLVKQKLIDMAANNRLGHALLFLGKEGSGALPLAMAFAQYISLLPSEDSLSENNLLFGSEQAAISLPVSASEADQWMQQQSSNSKAEQMVHPDIHYSYPVIARKVGTPPISVDFIVEWREFITNYPYGNIYDWLQFIGAENKQGNITAQECNDIIRKLNLKSFESNYKILILWMPEYLGKEGNKLLKLIEEPPLNTLFILVAENETGILPTILSRCQLIKVPAIENSDLVQALEKRNKLDSEKALRIAALSNGNYREAMSIVQNADEDFHHLLKEWLNACLRNQTIAQMKIIDEIARLGRENQKQFLNYFIHMLEQAIRYQINLQENILGTNSENEFLNRLNKAMSMEQMEAISNELNHAVYYIERNAHSKILFHALTIKIFYIVKSNIIFSY